MTRDTSTAAYHKIKDEGLLSQRRWQVYDVLFQMGPATASEVYKAFKAKYGTTISTNGSGSRLSELRDAGVVAELGTTICSVTSMTVIRWDVTSKLPAKFERKKKIDHRKILIAVWNHPECTQAIKKMITAMAKE